MNKALRFALIYMLLSTVGLAVADEAAESNYRGTSIAPISKYFSHFVRHVQKPFYLYHWRRNPSLVDSADAQTNPRKYGMQIVQEEGASFVPGLYANGRSRNLYGGGLYAAVDPLVTEDFGGREPSEWVLLEMRVPTGFQVLDLRITNETFSDADKQSIVEALTAFSCPVVASEYENFIGSLFRSDVLPRECADLLAHLMATFKVDAFLYGYGATGFVKCQTGTNRQVAAVLTSNTWLNRSGADANVYTSKTSARRENRRVIESLFRYGNTINAISSEAAMQNWMHLSKIVGDKVPAAQGMYQGINWSSTCLSPENCSTSITVTYSHDDKAVNADVEILPKDVERFLIPTYPTDLNGAYVSLRWSDLQSTPSMKDPEQWIHQNLFECADGQTLGPAR